MPKVLTPTGAVVEMTDEQAQARLAMSGYSLAGPGTEDSAPGDELRAGILGTARGLTFGLSDLALTMKDKAGQPIVPPERLAELKEQNPTASTVGELGGTLLPALLTGGSSVAAKGAASEAAGMTLPGLVSRAGQAVERGAMKALSGPTIRAVPGVAEEAAKRALSMGLGSTVETAAYSVGQAVSEAALGDPAKVAEHVFADVGLSAMLGFGLGAVGGAVAELTPHAIGAAKNAGAKRLGHWRDYLVEKYPKIAPMLGVDEDIARMTMTNRALLSENKEARNAVVRSLTDAATDVEYVNVAMGRLVHGGTLEEAVKVGAAKINPQAAAAETDRLLGLVEGSVGKMGSSPLDFDPGRVRQVAKTAMAAQEALGARPAEAIEALDAVLASAGKENLPKQALTDLARIRAELGSATPSSVQGLSERLTKFVDDYARPVEAGPKILDAKELGDALTSGDSAAILAAARKTGPEAERAAQALMEARQPVATKLDSLRSTIKSVEQTKPGDSIVAITREAPDFGDDLLRRALDTARGSLSTERKDAVLGALRLQESRLVSDVAEAGRTHLNALRDEALRSVREASAVNAAVSRTKELQRLSQRVKDDVLPKLAASVKGPAEQFATLRQVKRELDAAIPYGQARLALSPAEKAVVDEALTLRSAINDSLHDPSRWGDAGSLMARVDAAQQRLIQTREPLIAGGGLFTKRKGEGAGPFATYAVNPDKVEAWMRKVGSEGGEDRAKALAAYLDASKDYVKVYKDVHAAAGMDLPGMDAATITKLIGRTDDAVAKAKTQALLEQAAKAGSQSPDMLGGVAKPALGALGFGPTGFALGTLWSAYGFAKKPTAVASTLYTLEQSAQRVSKAIDNAAKTLMTGSVKAQHVGRGMAAAGLSKVFGEDEERSAKRFEKRLEGVAALVNNPTHLTNTLSAGMGGPMQEHAPKTNEALMNVNLRAVAEIDKVLKPKSRPGFMAGKPVYSQTEINAVNRVFEALDSGPDYLLKQAAAGTLTRAAVDVVRNVLPELYAAQVQNVLKYYVERGGGVDPSRRGMLSVLLGQDVDGMLRPVAVAATSASYAAMSEESKPGRKPSNPVTLASRTQTPVGQLAEGEKA